MIIHSVRKLRQRVAVLQPAEQGNRAAGTKTKMPHAKVAKDAKRHGPTHNTSGRFILPFMSTFAAMVGRVAPRAPQNRKETLSRLEFKPALHVQIGALLASFATFA